MEYIIKRDGSICPFNEDKIIDAIDKAFLDVDDKLYENDTAIDIAKDIHTRIKLIQKEVLE